MKSLLFLFFGLINSLQAHADLEFHPLDFEAGGVGAFQASGYSVTGFAAWTPELVFGNSGFGFKLRAGAAPYKATATSIFWSLDGGAWLTLRPGYWVEGQKFPATWSVELGGGAEYWMVTAPLLFPTGSIQLCYHFESKLWILERIVAGYRVGLYPGLTTHFGYAGLGLSLF